MRYLQALGVGALTVIFIGIGSYALDCVLGRSSASWLTGDAIIFAWGTGGLGWLWGRV